MVEQGPRDPSRRRFLRLGGDVLVVAGLAAISSGVGTCVVSDSFDNKNLETNSSKSVDRVERVGSGLVAGGATAVVTGIGLSILVSQGWDWNDAVEKIKKEFWG